MKPYAKFRQKEWNDVLAKARQTFIQEVLGDKPTYQSVRKGMPNPFRINPLEWGAVLVLLVLAVFTGFKVGAMALPFSRSLLTALTHTEPVADWVLHTFQIVTILMFILMSTFSLIYFKLLNEDPEIVELKRKSRAKHWYNVFSLEWISPRLPYLIVYGSVIWLIIVSNNGSGTAFEKFLPVVLEVGLAHLVGVLLMKREQFHQLVTDSLTEVTKPWEYRLENYQTDKFFLRILYQQMRTSIISLERVKPEDRDKRSARRYKVNAWIEEADGKTIDQIITDEYNRLNGGLHFAKAVQGTTPKSKSLSKAEKSSASDGRTPPAGERYWSPGTLARDLAIRQLTGKLTQADIDRDYAPGHKARKAWRDGAQELYLKAQED